MDPNDKETWGDSEHRLAYVSETTVIFKDIVQVRDDQWWKALSTGYITQWAAMYPQKIDALFYAHSLGEVKALAPLLERFRSTAGKKAYIVVSGGSFCPCEEAAVVLKWPKSVCKERRFKIFDLGIEVISGVSNSKVPILQAVYSSMKGLVKVHNPSLLIAVADIDFNVKNALKMAAQTSLNRSALVSVPYSIVDQIIQEDYKREDSSAAPGFYIYLLNLGFQALRILLRSQGCIAGLFQVPGDHLDREGALHVD